MCKTPSRELPTDSLQMDQTEYRIFDAPFRTIQLSDSFLRVPGSGQLSNAQERPGPPVDSA
jgi:hypothetical protein